MSRHGVTTPKPPIILSLENSGMCGSIALSASNVCIAEYSLTTTKTHSKRLLSSIEFILHEATLDWPEIDAIAVSLGPGSFTGLRIGLATAKGIAMATGKKLIGISSLDALAFQLQHSAKLICPAIDARKKQVYAAIYRHSGPNLQRLTPPMAIEPLELAAQIQESVIFIGDGGVLYKEILQDTLGEMVTFADPSTYFPRAAAIGSLALIKWHNKDFLDPAIAVPTYVRPSDAEISIKGIVKKV